MPIAAITYPSRGFERHPTWWPRFPWQQVTALVDAWIPMAYTGGGFKGYDATYGYVARSLRLLRNAVGPDIPIHAAGGVANRMNAEELKAFVDAVTDEGSVTGWSLYDFQTTGPKAWAALKPLGSGPSRPAAGSRPAAWAIDSRLPSARASANSGPSTREDELLELRPFALPLADAAERGLGLDGPPDQPGPLAVASRRGDRRELGTREHDVLAIADARRARASDLRGELLGGIESARDRARPTPRCRAGRAPTTSSRPRGRSRRSRGTVRSERSRSPSRNAFSARNASTWPSPSRRSRAAELLQSAASSSGHAASASPLINMLAATRNRTFAASIVVTAGDEELEALAIARCGPLGLAEDVE